MVSSSWDHWTVVPWRPGWEKNEKQKANVHSPHFRDPEVKQDRLALLFELFAILFLCRVVSASVEKIWVRTIFSDDEFTTEFDSIGCSNPIAAVRALSRIFHSSSSLLSQSEERLLSTKQSL